MSARASFVIPAYNSDRWISKAIWSCRNQSIDKVEIIIVDDGSTDATGTIADWHAKEDKRIKVFHQDNQGRSAARNFGNEQAQSDIIMVLDSDDLATRNRAKDTLAAFTLKKPDFLYGSFFAMDSMGNAHNKVISSPFDPVACREKKLNYICHSTVAYTKRLTRDVKYEGGDWSRLGLDDWKFQWEVYGKGYVIKNIRNPLCYYRVTEDNTMAVRDPKEVEVAKEAFLARV